MNERASDRVLINGVISEVKARDTTLSPMKLLNSYYSCISTNTFNFKQFTMPKNSKVV